MKEKLIKLKQKLIKIINIYRHSFKSSLLLVCFVISALINATLLRILVIPNQFKLHVILADLAVILILGALTFLFKKKHRIKYIMTLSIFFTIVCIANSIYYTYYSSFISVSLLATSVFVADVGDAVVENVLKITDFIYLWQPIFVYYMHVTLLKKGYYDKVRIDTKKRSVLSYACLGLLCYVIFALFVTTVEWGRFSKLWNRESVVASFGVYTYQFNDIVQSLQPKINNLFSHDKAYRETVEYYEENGYKEEKAKTNDYTGIFEGKNVITIHAESIQTIALEKEFNGEEVAPYLNKLASEGIFFNNFYSQVGVGTSSDAEFTFATSLMPSSRGTVFVNYFDRQYETIQKLFKEQGYYTFSMHGNTADFWNRAVMHENMGYDDFYAKSSFEINEEIGLGLSDKSFFKQAVEKMKVINEENDKFYGNLIMLTNHTPFSDLELMDEFPTDYKVEIDGQIISRPYLEGTTLGNYFRSVHYADQAIEQLINDMDEAGLLDNTVIVIYGDHDARISKKYYNIMHNYDPYTDTVLTSEDEGYTLVNDYTMEVEKNVPFIIWTKDEKFNKEVSTVAGMIDVLPTLGNMFNIHSDYQMGKDILSLKKDDNTVVFADGSYITNKIYYNSQKSEIFALTTDAVDQEYIDSRSKYADKIIEISNYIISYNLIKEMEEKNKGLS